MNYESSYWWIIVGVQFALYGMQETKLPVTPSITTKKQYSPLQEQQPFLVQERQVVSTPQSPETVPSADFRAKYTPVLQEFQNRIAHLHTFPAGRKIFQHAIATFISPNQVIMHYEEYGEDCFKKLILQLPNYELQELLAVHQIEEGFLVHCLTHIGEVWCIIYLSGHGIRYTCLPFYKRNNLYFLQEQHGITVIKEQQEPFFIQLWTPQQLLIPMTLQHVSEDAGDGIFILICAIGSQEVCLGLQLTELQPQIHYIGTIPLSE